jgi:hypothetical protein
MALEHIFIFLPPFSRFNVISQIGLQTIDGLQCARIRKEFAGLLPKSVARYYSISGKRGEAKKIDLVRANVI